MFPSLPVFLSADISFMAYVERGTDACFHTIWQPANLRQFVNFIRKVYVLMVTGAGKISKNVAVGWGFLYYTTLHFGVIRFVLMFSVYGLFFYFISDTTTSSQVAVEVDLPWITRTEPVVREHPSCPPQDLDLHQAPQESLRNQSCWETEVDPVIVLVLGFFPTIIHLCGILWN